MLWGQCCQFVEESLSTTLFQSIEVSKYLNIYAKRGLKELVTNPTLTIGDKSDWKWSHLSHIITTNFNDNDDIELRKRLGKLTKF